MKEDFEIVEYNPTWKISFLAERERKRLIPKRVPSGDPFYSQNNTETFPLLEYGRTASLQ